MSITNLTNTRWRFNLTPNFDVVDNLHVGSTYYNHNFTVNFQSNGLNYSMLTASKRYDGTHYIMYSYNTTYNINGTWSANAYREILITGGNAVQNADLIAWLESAAELIDRYYIDKSDLVSVADAIRAKGGTSEPLTFPDGFIEAINNL